MIKPRSAAVTRRGVSRDAVPTRRGVSSGAAAWIAPGFVEARLVGSDLGGGGVLTVVLVGLCRPVVRLEFGGRNEPDLAM